VAYRPYSGPLCRWYVKPGDGLCVAGRVVAASLRTKFRPALGWSQRVERIATRTDWRR